jgi:hypothetical protein
MSNATTEAIWQVQVSGCAAHCRGIGQAQIAEQENTTIQVLAGDPQVVTGSGALPETDAGSRPTITVTQVQLGCLSRCFGKSTTTGATIPASYRYALEQLLLAIAPDSPIPASYQEALEQLLLAISPGLPTLSAGPAAEQNTVEQLAYQWQDGQSSPLTQRQRASQVNNAVQVVDVSASPTADRRAVLGWSGDTTGEAVNQSAQGIWQLQIGCLIFCIETQQYQQAEQSNTTIQILTQPAGSSVATRAALVDLATQLVWQVQIGCLFWCWDATQVQVVVLRSTHAVIESHRSPSQPRSNAPFPPMAPSPPRTPSPPQTPWPPGTTSTLQKPSPTQETTAQRTLFTPEVGVPSSRGAAVRWGTLTVSAPGSSNFARSTAGGRLTGRSDHGGSVLGEASPPHPTARIDAQPSVRPIPSNVTLLLMSTARGAQPAKASTPRVRAPRTVFSLPVPRSAVTGAAAIGPADGSWWATAIAALFAAIALCTLRFAPGRSGRRVEHPSRARRDERTDRD